MSSCFKKIIKRYNFPDCRTLIIGLFIATGLEVYSQELDTALQANETLYHFDMKYYGSEYHVDPNYYYVLDEMAEWIAKDSTLHLHIRGHVCCGPSKRLSKRRAKKTYKYMLNAGIPKDRLSWKGYSDTCPRVWPEKTDNDAARNRRVDFVIRKIE